MSSLLDQIIHLRLLVAFLGEKKQHAWWDTSFLDATGRSFLGRPFPRTGMQAALRSATVAAVLVHDQAIGRIGAFHLFRLPVEREESVDIKISPWDGGALLPQIASRATAMAALAEISSGSVPASTGPVQVGLGRQLGNAAVIGTLAAHYHAAFAAGTKAYPYFAKDKNV